MIGQNKIFLMMVIYDHFSNSFVIVKNFEQLGISKQIIKPWWINNLAIIWKQTVKYLENTQNTNQFPAQLKIWNC